MIAKTISDSKYSIEKDVIYYEPDQAPGGPAIHLDFNDIKEIPSSLKIGCKKPCNLNINCDNKLTKFDLNFEGPVRQLAMGGDKIQSIDLSNFSNIDRLYIEGCNTVREIIAPKQEKLSCYIRKNSNLTELDLSGINVMLGTEPNENCCISHNKKLKNIQLPKSIGIQLNISENDKNLKTRRYPIRN